MLNIQTGFCIEIKSKQKLNKIYPEEIKNGLDIIPIVDITDEPALYTKNESE